MVRWERGRLKWEGGATGVSSPRKPAGRGRGALLVAFRGGTSTWPPTRETPGGNGDTSGFCYLLSTSRNRQPAQTPCSRAGAVYSMCTLRFQIGVGGPGPVGHVEQGRRQRLMHDRYTGPGVQNAYSASRSMHIMHNTSSYSTLEYITSRILCLLWTRVNTTS